MDDDTTDGSVSSPYFAARAEHLIGQTGGGLSGAAAHPGDGGEAAVQARSAALEDRVAAVERRLADLEGPNPTPSGPPGR